MYTRTVYWIKVFWGWESLSWIQNSILLTVQLQLKTLNLAIRGFQPSFDDRNSLKLSDLLYGWTKDILNDYELSPGNVLNATTDGGSNPKRLIERKLCVAREWCLPHFIHLAVQDAFGVSAKSKNNMVAHIT